VLYAGLHGLAQGLDQILAVAEALRADTKLRFVFIGDGLEKPELIRRAKQRDLTNVDFYDARPATEIADLLSAADIILVPLKTSIPGAVPSKLYEAMASSRPVILVASGEAAEIVREHQAGIVVEPGDVAAFAQAVRTLRAKPDLRRTLGENGRQAVEHHYDRATFVNRFIDYLETHL
jgi:glycosyltransferase involved in cell wall biosynthesis